MSELTIWINGKPVKVDWGSPNPPGEQDINDIVAAYKARPPTLASPNTGRIGPNVSRIGGTLPGTQLQPGIPNTPYSPFGQGAGVQTEGTKKPVTKKEVAKTVPKSQPSLNQVVQDLQSSLGGGFQRDQGLANQPQPVQKLKPGTEVADLVKKFEKRPVQKAKPALHLAKGEMNLPGIGRIPWTQSGVGFEAEFPMIGRVKGGSPQDLARNARRAYEVLREQKKTEAMSPNVAAYEPSRDMALPPNVQRPANPYRVIEMMPPREKYAAQMKIVSDIGEFFGDQLSKITPQHLFIQGAEHFGMKVPEFVKTIADAPSKVAGEGAIHVLLTPFRWVAKSDVLNSPAYTTQEKLETIAGLFLEVATTGIAPGGQTALDSTLEIGLNWVSKKFGSAEKFAKALEGLPLKSQEKQAVKKFFEESQTIQPNVTKAIAKPTGVETAPKKFPRPTIEAQEVQPIKVSAKREIPGTEPPLARPEKAEPPTMAKSNTVKPESSAKASPLEDLKSGEGTTGLANQVAERERQTGRLGTEVNIKGKSIEQQHKMGQKMYEKGEIDIESQMRKLANESRPATGVEYGAALEHKRRLMQRQDKAIKELDEAIKSGRRTDLGRLKQTLSDAEGAVTKWQNLVDESKTAWSDSGRGLQIGSTINEGSLAEVLQARARKRGVSVAELSRAEKRAAEKQVSEFQGQLKEAGVEWSPEKETLDDALSRWRDQKATKVDQAKAEAVIRGGVRRVAKNPEQLRAARAAARQRITAAIAKSTAQAGAGPGQAFVELVKRAPEIVDDVKIIVRSLADEFQIRVLDRKLFDAVRTEMPGVDISDDEIVKVLAGEWDAKIAKQDTLYAELSRQARKINAEPVIRAKEQLKQDLKAAQEAVRQEERKLAEAKRLSDQSKEIARKQAQSVEAEAERSLKAESKKRADAQLSDARKRLQDAKKKMSAAEREAEQGPLKESNAKLKDARKRMKEAEDAVKLAEKNERIVADAIEKAKQTEATRQADNALREQKAKLAERERETAKLEKRLEDLDELEGDIKSGAYGEDTKRRVAQVSKQQQRLDLLISARRRQIRQMINADEKGLAERAIFGVANFARSAKLGTDMGMLLRQGLFTLGRGRANLEGIKNAFRALKDPDGWDAINEAYFFKETADGKLLEPIRRQAGLATSDIHLDPEEFGVIKNLQKIRILGRLPGSLERAQSAFINTVRREAFDDFVAKFPNATAEELAARARFINAATGRSNWKDVPKALQVLMTSPRYTASRYEILGEAIRNPFALRSAAARENIKDMAVTAASIATALKLMEAVGFEVTWDPFSSDFLKVRRGGTVYDPTAGVGKALRTTLRIAAYGTGFKEAGYKGNIKEEVGKVLSDTISPAISTGVALTTGKSLIGTDLKPTERGFWNLAPLVVSGFAEGIAQDGVGRAAIDTIPEFFGIGVSRYPSAEHDAAGRPLDKKAQEKDKDVLSELERLGINLDLAKKEKEIPETDKERMARSRAAGDMVIQMARPIINSPSYRSASKTIKKDTLQAIASKARQSAHARFNAEKKRRKMEEHTKRVEEEMKAGIK